jgi:hypothetical protein
VHARFGQLISATAIAGLTSSAMPSHVLADPPRPLVTLTAPAVWADISAKEIKGRPARLAWSDDRSTLYLRTVEGATRESLVYHHYLVRKGKAPTPIDTQPEWVESYWNWKSAKNLSGDQSLSIEVDSHKEVLDNLNGTTANKAVYLTDAPNGLTGQQLMLSKQSGGMHVVNRLHLRGQVIGEFIDENIVPGYTFSWSPDDMRLIAFRSQSGRLTIMNDEGRTEPIADTEDVLLPAWSDDGAAIAYLQRAHGRFSLRVLEVEGR